MNMKKWVRGTLAGAAVGFLSALAGSAWAGVLFPLPLTHDRAGAAPRLDGFIMGIVFICICVPAVVVGAIVGGLVGGFWGRKP